VYIVIRKSNPKDVPSIRRVLHDAHLQNSRKGFRFPASAFMGDRIKYLIRRQDYYVLTFDRKVIGTVAVKNRKVYLEIGSLAIRPKYQKRGLGRRLLYYAENVIRKRRHKKAYLFTPKHHSVLPRYYYAKGYRLVKTVRMNRVHWVMLRKVLR
jgi:N-acetylglutamate synthase-like GNAT family acetyltransferase